MSVQRETDWVKTALANMATDPRMAMEAAFQAAGAHNESLQKRVQEGELVTAADWAELRAHVGEVYSRPNVTAFQRGRLRLIAAESLYWEKDFNGALAGCRQLLATADEAADRRTAGMAHFIAGECLQTMSQHAQALVHFAWIVDEFGEEELWGALTKARRDRKFACADRARLHYNIFHSMRRLDYPLDELIEVGQKYADEFPDAKHTPLVVSFLIYHSAFVPADRPGTPNVIQLEDGTFTSTEE